MPLLAMTRFPAFVSRFPAYVLGRTLRAGVLLAACSIFVPFAPDVQAQGAYPTRAVRYVLSDSPGSNIDVLARIVAEGLSRVYGQQIVVDNRPGAGGNIGAEIAARAQANGYTMAQIATTHAVNATLYRRLGYDLLRDFAPVTNLASGPSIAVVPVGSPIRSVADLVRMASAKPGGLTYASAGTGTCTFLAGELFKKRAGVDLLHVPYKGGPPAVTAVVSGEVSVYFAPLAAALPHIKQGRLRPLAVSTGRRLPFAPEYPTLTEAGVAGYEFACWYGMVVPAGTPPAIVATIHGAVTKVLQDTAVQKRLGDMGFVPIGDSPEEFGAYIKAQIESFRPIVKDLPQPQ
jgi:tripartite-type tricarboxylate transporter receptor subunit TctC